MNHQETHQTNLMIPWDSLDVPIDPSDPLKAPLDPLGSLNIPLKGKITCSALQIIRGPIKCGH